MLVNAGPFTATTTRSCTPSCVGDSATRAGAVINTPPVSRRHPCVRSACAVAPRAIAATYRPPRRVAFQELVLLLADVLEHTLAAAHQAKRVAESSASDAALARSAPASASNGSVPSSAKARRRSFVEEAEALAHELPHQGLLVGEVAVDRTHADARATGDVVHLHLGLGAGEQLARGLEDSGAIAASIGTHRAGGSGELFIAVLLGNMRT